MEQEKSLWLSLRPSQWPDVFMIMNNLNSKLKSLQKNPSMLLYGFLVIFLYKGWKYFVISNMLTSYYGQQFYFTVYRAVATLVGLVIINKFYKDFDSECFVGNRKLLFVNIFLMIPLSFFLRRTIFDFTLDNVKFFFELFFNFFTGSFEEVFFRGIILVGFSLYFKPLKSIVLSSVVFSLWHYDVVSGVAEYVIIFIWSLYASFCFLNGASLLSLIVFHFLWDQVVFGFQWEAPGSDYLYLTFILENLMVIIPLLVLFRDQIRVLIYPETAIDLDRNSSKE